MNEWFEAEQRVERAQQLTESQRWVEALVEIEAALAINPNNSSWHAQRGYLLEELDRSSDAVVAYEASLQLEPGDRDTKLALGIALTRLGRLARAMSVFEELAKAHAEFEPAYCHRIHVYAQLGQHEQAEQMFYLAQELEEDCPHCFYHIAESLAARGQTERALYCWHRVLELEPHYIGVNRRIARAHRSNGRLDDAREFLLRELRDDPGDTGLLFELAELALELDDIETAAAKFSQILELDEEHIEALYALGAVRMGQGKASEAIDCFEAIESISGGDPGLPSFDRKFGEALLHVNQYKEAAKRFEKAALEDGDQPEVHMLHGTCLLAGGKPKLAADCFRRALALDAENAYAHHSLGVCVFQGGSYEAGLRHCLEAIRLKPDFTVAMCNAAVGYLRLARWKEARLMLRRAAAIDPENAGLQKLLKRVWRFQGRHWTRRFFAPIRWMMGLFSR